MLDDDESYYKELPYTLTQDQSKPQFVIFGTGLQECLIAAHYSKVQMKPGLILDVDRTYGSCLKTVTIKQLYALSTQKIKINLYRFLKFQEFEELNKKFYDHLIQTKTHRGYNIDLEPNFFFGSSVTCELLKEADMDKYMDFRLVNNMLRYDGKDFKNVPLSKGKIFQSKDLGLLEKKLLLNTFHSLSQVYNKFMNVTEDQNSTKQFDKQFGQVDQKLYLEFLAEKTNNFTKFLQKLTKNNQKIMNYIVYILCNYQYNYRKQLPAHVQESYTLEAFIKRFGKFVKSCGVYGECPYLYVDNGIGDVPQAFSRIASIYLSTYILHPRIEISKIEQDSENSIFKIYTNLYPNGFIQTKQIFYGPTCYDLKFKNEENYEREHILRVIIIASKTQNEEENPSIVYLLDLPSHENPVYLFVLDSVSHTCPEGQVVYQFETIIQNSDESHCISKVKSYINVLTQSKGQNFKPLYVTAYLRQKRYPKTGVSQSNGGVKQHILRDHSGIDLDSHFINFKETVGEHPLYFKKTADQNIHNDDWNGPDETTGLIERLQQIDLNKEPLKEQQTLEQAKLQIENAQAKEQKQKQKHKEEVKLDQEDSHTHTHQKIHE